MLFPSPWFGQGTRVMAQEQTPGTVSGGGSDLTYVCASIKSRGVLVEWRSKPDPDNLGFNIYRVHAGHRSLLNAQLIPGVIFAGSKHVAPPGDYTFSRFDAAGTAESIYYIESVSVDGLVLSHGALAPLLESKPSWLDQTWADSSSAASASAESSPQFQKGFPAGSDEIASPGGPIENQWNIAAQPGLKIYIKSDGWYRVTRQQMGAAGFNPTVDIRNLSLFSDGLEVAIGTSKDVGQLTSADYIEFYGRGLDTSAADTRIYYLIAGIGLGKRIVGEVKTNSVSEPPLPVVSLVGPPLPLQPGSQHSFGWLFQFLNGVADPVSTRTASAATPPERNRLPRVEPGVEIATQANPDTSDPARGNSEAEATALEAVPKTEVAPPLKSAPADSVKQARRTTGALTVTAKKGGAKRNGKRKSKPRARRERSHANASVVAAAVSFAYTVQIKERYRNDAASFNPVYFVSLLNGDTENYFGRVIASAPVMQTFSAPNPEASTDGPAKIEIALQGVPGQSFLNHTVNVDFNGTRIATLSLGPLEHLVRTINIPVAQIINGANTVKFTRVSTGDVSLVDYVRLTYPHALKADNNALRFSLRSTQAAKIDGFAGQDIRLIDYTDPIAVKVVRPIMETSASGYSVTVPPGRPAKHGRLLYATSETQFAQPAALSLNGPSTLNAAANGADLLIIAHKSLIASAAPLASLRQSQGLTVSVVDVEDVYDEFSYGAHGPQAIKDFLARARSSWTRPPKYVIFLGDASLDPRNYEGVGDFDLVPTKLVDATYNETASDDWLADFDNDGIGDIPTGRLPVRTPAEATLAISKIVNFAPTNAPQSALLVADDPTNYYFNFELSNDDLQSQLQLLVPSMTVQRVNKRTDSNPHDSITTKLNQGQALVNYSGHGNVNTWTGANIFTSVDASAAGNGNKLPLVLVMNCLNGYFQDPRLEGIAEALIKAPNGGAVAVFASSGETIPDGQQDMSRRLYSLLYGSQSISLGDAIKDAKGFTTDIDVRRTWIFFGDPSMKIR
jgi:hypothetical protein